MSDFDWGAAEDAVAQWEAGKAAAPAPPPALGSVPSLAPTSLPDLALTQHEAVSLAKIWYDEQGPFVGTFEMVTPVSAAHFNYVGPKDCECSIRYNVRPDTGESYFVRFIYELPFGTTKWRAVGMDMARASELPDSESETVARSWRALVERCARALGRSASNLPAYTSSTSVSRQLAALGAENAQKILKLAEQSTDESSIIEDDSKWLLSTVGTALKQSAVANDNGARAGLAAIKWIAGSGVKYKNPGGPRKKSNQSRSTGVVEGAPDSMKRKYATIKSDPGTSGAQSANSNDVDEHWGPLDAVVQTAKENCLACTTGSHCPCTCGRKWPRPVAQHEQQTDGSVLSTDTTSNDSYKDWSESRGKRELYLESVDQRLDRQWQEEEQQRRDKEARKRQAASERKKRREAQYVGSGVTRGRWRVVLKSTWWGPQYYAV